LRCLLSDNELRLQAEINSLQAEINSLRGQIKREKFDKLLTKKLDPSVEYVVADGSTHTSLRDAVLYNAMASDPGLRKKMEMLRYGPVPLLEGSNSPPEVEVSSGAEEQMEYPLWDLDKLKAFDTELRKQSQANYLYEVGFSSYFPIPLYDDLVARVGMSPVTYAWVELWRNSEGTWGRGPSVLPDLPNLNTGEVLLEPSSKLEELLQSLNNALREYYPEITTDLMSYDVSGWYGWMVSNKTNKRLAVFFFNALPTDKGIMMKLLLDELAREI
jgi:hypothetical protein